MDNYAIVRDAIINKQTVIAEYDGFHRELCPHAIGWGKGMMRALFYQSGGETSKGTVVANSPGNWRCLEIAKLQITGTRQGWSSVTTTGKRSSCLDTIDFEITS